MTNLPDWNGAAKVYERAERVCSILNADKYKSDRLRDKRKSFKFTPDERSLEIIEAMNKGDEELLKGLVHQYRDCWLYVI